MEIDVAKALFSYMGVVAVLMLAARGLYDVASSTGLLALIPKVAERKRQQELNHLLDLLKGSEDVIRTHEDERLERLLLTVGILDRRQLGNVRQAVQFVKMAKERSVGNAQDEIKQYCANFTIDQQAVSSNRAVFYSKVRYYIDLVDASTDSTYSERLAELLQFLIAQEMKTLQYSPDVSLDFDRIAIPKGGNYFLGASLSAKLRKPLVVILDEPRIYSDCYWMGDLQVNDRVILVNDVGVSGERLASSADTIRKFGGATVKHVFVLVERKEWNACEYLRNCSDPLQLHALVKLNDEDLAVLTLDQTLPRDGKRRR